MRTVFAFVRCKRLPDLAAIAAASSHALGSDRSARSRRREGYDGPRALALIKGKSGWERAAVIRPPKDGETPDKLPLHVDYPAAYQRHLDANNAKKAPNAHAAMHLIIGVSPEYFGKSDGTHQGHDIKSKKVVKLLATATHWAEAELGGVWAARYDLDERGFGVVDVMCSPIRPHGKNGQPTSASARRRPSCRKRIRGPQKATVPCKAVGPITRRSTSGKCSTAVSPSGSQAASTS